MNNRIRNLFKLMILILTVVGLGLIIKGSIPKVIKTPYNVKSGGRKIKIAIIDTGAKLDHQAISTFMVNQKYENLIDQRHGTGVVGIITETLTKVYGTQAPELFQLELFSYNHDTLPKISQQQYLKALEDAIFSDPDIINISTYGYPFFDEEAVLLKIAANRGIKVVTAAGNDAGNIQRTYPCGLSYVICVGSTDSNSNIGSHVDLNTSGVRIAPASDDVGYEKVVGTSFAAPFVTAYYASLMVNSKSYDFFKKDIKVNPTRAKEPELLIQAQKDRSSKINNSLMSILNKPQSLTLTQSLLKKYF